MATTLATAPVTRYFVMRAASLGWCAMRHVTWPGTGRYTHQWIGNRTTEAEAVAACEGGARMRVEEAVRVGETARVVVRIGN